MEGIATREEKSGSAELKRHNDKFVSKGSIFNDSQPLTFTPLTHSAAVAHEDPRTSSVSKKKGAPFSSFIERAHSDCAWPARMLIPMVVDCKTSTGHTSTDMHPWLNRGPGAPQSLAWQSFSNSQPKHMLDAPLRDTLREHIPGRASSLGVPASLCVCLCV